MDNQTHYKIHISKLNEVYLKVECDNPGICYELVQYFTFEVPGHKFMPAYRNKIWDGKIRLFSDKTGKIYVGLLSYIKEFCDRNEIGYDVDDDVNEIENLNIDKVNDFVKNTKIQTGLFDLENMEDVKLRLEAVNELLKNQKKMQAETQILAGGKVEIAKGELILKDELFDGLKKERDQLLKILMNQKEITQEKKFQITEVKNIHEAHISTLKVEKEKPLLYLKNWL